MAGHRPFATKRIDGPAGAFDNRGLRTPAAIQHSKEEPVPTPTRRLCLDLLESRRHLTAVSFAIDSSISALQIAATGKADHVGT